MSSCLQVSAEETKQQVACRAARLGIQGKNLVVAVEDDVGKILSIARSAQSKLVVIDSLAAVMNVEKPGERGSAAQLTYCLEEITRYAKSSNTAFLVICQSTKSGGYAGPRVLEHMGDALLTMTALGDSGRVKIGIPKNRFGSTQKKAFLKFDPSNGRLLSDQESVPR